MRSEARGGDEDAGDDGAESDGYVHRPDGESTSGDDGELGARGWVLVGVIVLSTLVIPGVIYLAPSLIGSRVPFLVAMLALPFVPAVLLGATAVWSMAED